MIWPHSCAVITELEVLAYQRPPDCCALPQAAAARRMTG